MTPTFFSVCPSLFFGIGGSTAGSLIIRSSFCVFSFLHAADLSDPDTFRDQEGKVSDREMRSASLTLKQVGEKLGKRPLQQPMNRKQARTCWCTHRRQNLAAVHHGDPSAESGLPERSQRRSESCDKDLPVK